LDKHHGSFLLVAALGRPVLREEVERLVRRQDTWVDGWRDSVVISAAGCQQGMTKWVRRQPCAELLRGKTWWKVVDDPEKRLARALDLRAQEPFYLRRCEAGSESTRRQGLKDTSKLSLPLRLLSASLASPRGSVGPQPIDPAAVSRSKTERVLFREEALADAGKTLYDSHAAARGACNWRELKAVECRMHLPHRLMASDEPRRANRRDAVPGWTSQRRDMTEGAAQTSDTLGHGRGKASRLFFRSGDLTVERVTKFDRVDVFGASLGIDHEDTTPRIALPLSGEKRCRELELTSPARGVRARVVGHERL
jgi:hypothetical protein